jgi:hypothetical protein
MPWKPSLAVSGMDTRLLLYFLSFDCSLGARRGYAEVFSRNKPHMNIGTIGLFSQYVRIVTSLHHHA